MSFITLTTDFGLKDGNVGVMKGVIWGIAPHAHIADLSHLIGPQNIREAALILLRSAPFFPQGTIHVAVIDPGVGTPRRPIAARLGPQRFVGPDNGVITLLLDYAHQNGWPVEIIHLNRPQFWLPDVSNVFHGRDIFAPSAGHLAAGVPLLQMGTRISDPILLELPAPQKLENVWSGEVIHIDHFGNISTNIRREHLGAPGAVSVHLGGAEIPGLFKTFGERPAGELMALYGSTGNLIVSEVNGSAAGRLGVKVGDPVQVIIQ